MGIGEGEGQANREFEKPRQRPACFFWNWLQFVKYKRTRNEPSDFIQDVRHGDQKLATRDGIKTLYHIFQFCKSVALMSRDQRFTEVPGETLELRLQRLD